MRHFYGEVGVPVVAAAGDLKLSLFQVVTNLVDIPLASPGLVGNKGAVARAAAQCPQA